MKKDVFLIVVILFAFFSVFVLYLDYIGVPINWISFFESPSLGDQEDFVSLDSDLDYRLGLTP